MKAAPLPVNETSRLDALRGAHCAYAPREERFDRITRTAKRLLHVPISLVSILEQDEQWFRSVQGLEVAHTPRDISFCGHVVALNQPICIPDTWDDPDFADNPLVIGPPGIRSYLGWPLELAPGVAVGTLCVIDTMPRTFGLEDFEAMKDLANMAQAELKISEMSTLQNRLLMQLSTLQRKGALDPLTGCWNIRGFRELVALGFEDARRQATLRQRLPVQGALARLGARDFCALVPFQLKSELLKLNAEEIVVEVPDGQLKLEISLSIQLTVLSELGLSATPDSLWGHALAFSGRLNTC